MQFQKWPKIHFWTGKKFKTTKNAISRKKFYLIYYFALTFLNFLAHQCKSKYYLPHMAWKPLEAQMTLVPKIFWDWTILIIVQHRLRRCWLYYYCHCFHFCHNGGLVSLEKILFQRIVSNSKFSSLWIYHEAILFCWNETCCLLGFWKFKK